MTEIRKDPFSGSVVIYSPERENRPDFTGVKRSIELSPENCPFCEGNEDMTPPEIFRVAEGNSSWKIRVIPNKFPVLNVEENCSRADEGIFERFAGAGAHEIIIETPSHFEDITLRDTDYFKNIFITYRDRIRDLKKDFRLQYIQIFKNHKASAGATISHHHSQLIALPYVPDEVEKKLALLKVFYKKNKRSLFSEIISLELEHKNRIVEENKRFVAMAPWYSRTPYQVSLYQKEGYSRFEDIRDKDLESLSEIFTKVMKKLISALGDLPFNFVLYNLPFTEKDDAGFNWYIEILPAIGGAGGFEAATGTYINTVLPEKAAETLRRF